MGWQGGGRGDWGAGGWGGDGWRHGGAGGGGGGGGAGRGKGSEGGKGSGGSGGGKGGKGSKRPPRTTDSLETVVYSTWPMSKTEFPEEGPYSFRELAKEAAEAGCEVTLRHRSTKKRLNRAATLVIRGQRCRDIYDAFLDAAVAQHIDLSRVLPPIIITLSA